MGNAADPTPDRRDDDVDPRLISAARWILVVLLAVLALELIL